MTGADSADLAMLEAALAAAVPVGAAWSLGPLRETADRLFPEEEETVAAAVAGRRIEFAAGRSQARSALAALGAAPGPIPAGADRAPLWPLGFVGSITHTRSIAAAAVAPATAFASLGLDVEEVRPEIDRIAPMVLAPSERAGFEALAGAERRRTATLIFSIKEAVFKAHWPLTRRFLEFADVTVALAPGLGGFEASVRPIAAEAPPQVYRGRCGTPGRFALAIVACGAAGSDLRDRSCWSPSGVGGLPGFRNRRASRMSCTPNVGS